MNVTAYGHTYAIATGAQLMRLLVALRILQALARGKAA